MHTEVTEVTFCDKLTQGVRHTADAELNRCAVSYVRQNVPSDADVGLGGSGIRHLIQRRIAALDYHIDLTYVYANVFTAEYPRRVAVDLNYDDGAVVGNAL